VYIGETSRVLTTRIDVHLAAYGKPNKHSAFAEHLLEEGHHPTESSFELLHQEDSYRRRLALKHLEIICHRDTT